MVLSEGLESRDCSDLLISCLHTYSKIEDAVPNKGMKHLHPFLCQQCLLMENFMVVFQYEKTTLSSLGGKLPADVISPGKFRAALTIESGMVRSK